MATVFDLSGLGTPSGAGSLVLLCYLVCFLIFTLVAVNSRVSKLAEGVKRRHKPQRPEQSAVAME